MHFCFGTQIVRMFANFCDRRLPSDTQNFEARAVVYANNLEKSCLEATILWTTENQTMCLSTFFVVSLFWVLIWTFTYSVSSSNISFSSSPCKDIPPKMVMWSFLGPSKWRDSKQLVYLFGFLVLMQLLWFWLVSLASLCFDGFLWLWDLLNVWSTQHKFVVWILINNIKTWKLWVSKNHASNYHMRMSVALLTS